MLFFKSTQNHKALVKAVDLQEQNQVLTWITATYDPTLVI